MIEIKRYVSGLMSSNMYVVAEGNHAIVIDPYEDVVTPEGMTIDHIILTHEHYDHISGVNIWKKARAASVLCSRACAENIQNPKKNLAYYFKEFCELQTWMKIDTVPPYDPSYSCSADITFEGSLFLDWQGHTCHLFELPGHSMGSIGVIIDGAIFFSGDSLLENTDVALRLPGGSQKKWKEISLPLLSGLPRDIHIYPGHFSDFVYDKALI